jgi:hypothetical protein
MEQSFLFLTHRPWHRRIGALVSGGGRRVYGNEIANELAFGSVDLDPENPTGCLSLPFPILSICFSNENKYNKGHFRNPH